MSRTKKTANEVQLKARRTSLGKKSNDELINIILRKDSTERKNNVKIQELTALVNKANALSEERFEGMMSLTETIRTKQVEIDGLISERNTLTNEVNQWSKKYVNLKTVAKLRRKVIFTCFGVIAILIFALLLLF